MLIQLVNRYNYLGSVRSSSLVAVHFVDTANAVRTDHVADFRVVADIRLADVLMQAAFHDGKLGAQRSEHSLAVHMAALMEDSCLLEDNLVLKYSKPFFNSPNRYEFINPKFTLRWRSIVMLWLLISTISLLLSRLRRLLLAWWTLTLRL